MSARGGGISRLPSYLLALGLLVSQASSSASPDWSPLLVLYEPEKAQPPSVSSALFAHLTTQTPPSVPPAPPLEVTPPLASPGRLKRPLESGCNQDVFVGIVLQTDKTMETIHEVKEPFTQANLNSSWDEVARTIPSIIDQTFLELCDLDQSCSRVLPILPRAPHLPPEDHQSLQLHLSRSLEIVWSYLMAHVQIMLDQTLYEDGGLMRELNQVYREYEVLSILLSEAAMHCDAVPDDSALRDLLIKMHTRTVKISRSLRGFGVFRQSLIGLQYVKSVFSRVAADGIPAGDVEDEEEVNTTDRIVSAGTLEAKEDEIENFIGIEEEEEERGARIDAAEREHRSRRRMHTIGEEEEQEEVASESEGGERLNGGTIMEDGRQPPKEGRSERDTILEFLVRSERVAEPETEKGSEKRSNRRRKRKKRKQKNSGKGSKRERRGKQERQELLNVFRISRNNLKYLN